jgi:AcrR family transcriptional regulator
LAAARRQFAERGYHGATVDAIAEEAGFSKGAVYSQFGSKDDLMLAVLEASIEDRQRRSEEVLDACGVDVGTDEVIRLAYASSASTLAWQTALLEFRIHAGRDPAVNARYRVLHERTIGYVADALARLIERADLPVSVTPRQLATALLAGDAGVTVERLVSPELDPLEVLHGIAALASPVTSGGGGRP